mgnify:CR=1 FL=1
MSLSKASEGDEPIKGRLIISHMVVENFKSYAGEQKIGPFDSNMSSVIGPNGSGKSNVIDAMLFVFGFSAKKMRQNHASELIHKSDQYPDLGYVKVHVHFENVIDLPEGGCEPVPNTKLVVSREAKRDNTSTYRVDGKACDKKTVTTLLRKRGIDLDHNRFLILQGEVEAIAMMKPKAQTVHEEGLLEYLEDIIGSNKYVPEIEEAHKDMEELNEERSRKQNAMKMASHDVEKLEPAKAEAELCLQTERQKQEKQSALYQKSRNKASAFAVEVEEKRDALSARLADEKSKAGEKEDELKSLEKVFKKSKKEHDKGVVAQDESRKEYQALEKEDIKLREEIKGNKAHMKKLLAGADKDNKKLGECRGEMQALQQDVPRLEAEEDAITATIAKEEKVLEAQYDGLKGQTEPLRKKIEAKQQTREPEAESLAELQSEEQLAQSERQVHSASNPPPLPRPPPLAHPWLSTPSLPHALAIPRPRCPMSLGPRLDADVCELLGRYSPTRRALPPI